MENKEKKEWVTILAIFLIALVILLFSYFFIFNEITNKDIQKNKDNVEIINNQKNTLDNSEIDIKELEKQLDELDVNVDDIFEQLD